MHVVFLLGPAVDYTNKIMEELSLLSFVYWTEQHLLFPVNFCHIATACIHDNRMVCASTSDGCSRRNFMDQCDMYEYNCDYGTRYQETYFLYCKASDLKGDENTLKYATSIASHTPCATSVEPTQILTPAEDSDCDYIEAESIATTKTTTRIAPCTYATPLPLTGNSWMTSKIIQCITPRSTIWETKPILTVQTTSKPSLLTTTMRTIMEKFIKCCNRPVIWLTTTAKIAPVSLPYVPLVNNVLIETEEDVIMTPTTYRIVINDVTTPLEDPSDTYSQITETPTKNMPATKEHTTISITVPPTTDEPITRDENTVVITKQELSKSTQPSVKSTIKSTTIFEFKIPSTPLENFSTKGSGIIILKLDEQLTTKKRPWWYPTLCPLNKCQRPMVWSTTTKFRRHRRN